MLSHYLKAIKCIDYYLRFLTSPTRLYIFYIR